MASPRTVVVIPARFDSQRFRGKPLANIAGKLLIHRTWLAAIASGIPEVYVATDDDRIFEACESFGASAIMTGDARNGTERCALFAERFGLEPDDVIINLQGDACLVPPEWLVRMADHFRVANTDVATFVARTELNHPGMVTAIPDAQGKALYFTRGEVTKEDGRTRLHHFGVYGYRAKALYRYLHVTPWFREQAEGLEQLRFLEHNLSAIRLLPAPTDRMPWFEVNNPADVLLVEQELTRWGIR